MKSVEKKNDMATVEGREEPTLGERRGRIRGLGTGDPRSDPRLFPQGAGGGWSGRRAGDRQKGQQDLGEARSWHLDVL